MTHISKFHKTTKVNPIHKYVSRWHAQAEQYSIWLWFEETLTYSWLGKPANKCSQWIQQMIKHAIPRWASTANPLEVDTIEPPIQGVATTHRRDRTARTKSSKSSLRRLLIMKFMESQSVRTRLRVVMASTACTMEHSDSMLGDPAISLRVVLIVFSPPGH